MKKFLPVAAVAFLPVSLFPSAANATVAIDGTVDLHFGMMTAGATGGTVKVSPAGARTKTGSVTLVTGAGLESNAVLSITGNTGVAIEVTMGAATFTVDDAGTGVAMNVSAFDIDGQGTAGVVTLSASPDTFPLGATLTVGSGQVAGTYTGSYSVTANYQ